MDKAFCFVLAWFACLLVFVVLFLRSLIPENINVTEQCIALALDCKFHFCLKFSVFAECFRFTGFWFCTSRSLQKEPLSAGSLEHAPSVVTWYVKICHHIKPAIVSGLCTRLLIKISCMFLDDNSTHACW